MVNNNNNKVLLLNDHNFCENKLSYLFISILPMTAPPKAELDARLQGDLVTIRAGSDLVLDAAVGGKPEPKIIWTKGDKELDLCEKVSLQYTGKRATAVIKFCDRSDSGKYTLTVKNASGTKAVSVMVKVLGKHVKFFYFLQHFQVWVEEKRSESLLAIDTCFRFPWPMWKPHRQQSNRGKVHFSLEPSSGRWRSRNNSLHCGKTRD